MPGCVRLTSSAGISIPRSSGLTVVLCRALRGCGPSGEAGPASPMPVLVFGPVWGRGPWRLRCQPAAAPASRRGALRGSRRAFSSRPGSAMPAWVRPVGGTTVGPAASPRVPRRPCLSVSLRQGRWPRRRDGQPVPMTTRPLGPRGGRRRYIGGLLGLGVPEVVDDVFVLGPAHDFAVGVCCLLCRAGRRDVGDDLGGYVAGGLAGGAHALAGRSAGGRGFFYRGWRGVLAGVRPRPCPAA